MEIIPVITILWSLCYFASKSKFCYFSCKMFNVLHAFATFDWCLRSVKMMDKNTIAYYVDNDKRKLSFKQKKIFLGI